MHLLVPPLAFLLSRPLEINQGSRFIGLAGQAEVAARQASVSSWKSPGEKVRLLGCPGPRGNFPAAQSRPDSRRRCLGADAAQTPRRSRNRWGFAAHLQVTPGGPVRRLGGWRRSDSPPLTKGEARRCGPGRWCGWSQGLVVVSVGTAAGSVVLDSAATCRSGPARGLQRGLLLPWPPAGAPPSDRIPKHVCAWR